VLSSTIDHDSNSIEENSRFISLPNGVKSETGRFFISSYLTINPDFNQKLPNGEYTFAKNSTNS